MNKKALLIGGGALAVVAIVVALLFVFLGGKDEYRSIKVFEIDGNCTVERGGDTLDAFKNMALSSGDSLSVGEGSFARLKLDDDKYVYLEANTRINLTATGTANDSKTMVYVERGSMLTEVKKKLSATSSYDIVTPNTTMSIRGTKTLTQVIEDAVTGHVQTSNAVLEGQVKIKAVKVKADGTVVSVEKDLGAGEGNAFKSAKEELVSQEEMQAIAETGASVSGIKVEIVSEEEAGVVFDVATFDATFLESVKNILIADAEAAAGEGLSDEEMDAIREQLDQVMDSFDLIREESQNAIYIAELRENELKVIPEYWPTIDPSTIPDAFPEPEPETAPELPPVTADENDPEEGTVLIDGDTSLVVIGDDADEEEDDTADDAGTGDENVTDDDTDETGADEEDADNDDIDEEDKAGEDEEENVDKEDSDEEDADKEDADKEDADKEDDDKEDDEEGTDEEATPEPEVTPAPEPTPEAEVTPEPASVTDPTPSVTPEPTPTPDPIVTVNYGSTTAFVRVGSSSDNQVESLNLVFWEERNAEGSSTPERYTLNQGELPTTFTAGSALPGTSGSSIHVELDSNWSARYEFAGWYSSANGARDLNSAEFVSVAPSTEGVNLYPGVKERTFTVTFVNLFPEAGKMVLPDPGYWGDYQYNVVDTEANSRVTVSGIPYDGTIGLPDVEGHIKNNAVKEKYLHIEGAHAPEEEQGPFFIGVGAAYSGNNDSLTFSSNLNLTRILMDDAAYIQSVGSDFISYDEDNRDNYQAETSIRSDMTFYLYFSIPVHIAVSDSYDIVKQEYYGKMYDVYGNLASVEDAVKTYPGYDNEGSFDNGQFVRLRVGNNTNDQYWMVTKEVDSSNPDEPIWHFTSHYYGKPLDIPSFSWGAPDGTYLSYYSVSRQGKKATYINEVAPGIVSALTISGTGSSSFPYNMYKKPDGSLSADYLSFILNKTGYAILDLSGSGASVELGDNYLDVIRTSTEQSGIYKVREVSEYFGNSWEQFVAVTPEDGIYDMYLGGMEWDSSEYSNVKNERFFISKSGYRFAGYSLSAYRWDDTDLSEPVFSSRLKLYNSGNGIILDGTRYYEGQFDPDFHEKFITYLERENYKYVLKPVFVPEGDPFTVELVRTSGHIVNTSVDDNLMDYYNVEISFSQPNASDGTPYISRIDLNSFFATGYDYTFGNSGEYKMVGLQGTIKWDPDDGVYYLYDADGEKTGDDSGYVPANSKLLIPLEDLVDGDDYYGMQFVMGIDVVPDNPQTLYVDESITHYKTSILGDTDCGISALGDSVEYWNYCPWGTHIEVDPYTAPYAFTGVYAKSGGTASIAAIFSEVKDTLPNDLLLVVSGKSSLAEVWYGGKLSDNGDYGAGDSFVVEEDEQGNVIYDELTEIFPWTVTRASTGGPASKAIKGNLEEYPRQQEKYVDENGLLYDFGSGVLVFEMFDQLYIPEDQMSTVKVYPHADGAYRAIKDNALDLTVQGLPSGYNSMIKTAAQFRRSSNQTKFVLRMDECPEGWAHITDGDNNDGYVYIGSNTAIGGRLIMNENTEYLVPRIPV